MKYLLDTHICLWAISNKSKLSAFAKEVLENPEAEIMVSQISLWEIAIKYRLGKFPEFNSTLAEFAEAVNKAGFMLLPLRNEHLISYFDYPYFIEEHKDPFDRLLLVTASVEQANFITKDEKFHAYKKQITIVW